MLEERQSLTEYFRTILLTVVGQAFTAADYHLDKNPIQQAGGLFRFRRKLDAHTSTTIEYQVLVYTDNMWATGNPSRFRVNLSRSGDLPITRTLSALVVEDFGVAILPSSNHWWGFHDTTTLGQALAESGHLVVGYGIPWLAGELLPPDTSD